MRTNLIIPGLCAALALPMLARDIETFVYSDPEGNSGLHIRTRDNNTAPWTPLPGDRTLVSSDYGPWGSHKKMFRPRLFMNAADSLWTAVWEATPDGEVTALATSPDLIHWAPQRYLASPLDLPADMRPLSPLTPDTILIDGKQIPGMRVSIAGETIDNLIRRHQYLNGRDSLYNEQAKDDAVRFASLQSPTLTLTPNEAAGYPISDKLIGIFFEDINYGADGGLYAELVQNRDFEYNPSDRGNDRKWHSLKAWKVDAPGGAFTISSATPVHQSNPHYLAVKSGSAQATVVNKGFDGIPVVKGDRYLFSMKSRSAGKRVPVTVELTDTAGRVLARGTVKVSPTGWSDYNLKLKANQSTAEGRLRLSIPAGSDIQFDMVSLFPEKTFNGDRNGLRADLATLLADMKPRFVRFPGGCVAHGDGIDNIYDWKGSIGPLEARRPLRNLWGYHQTRGLGYFEYFRFCEEIGAEPLPVVSAGVPCQNSGTAPSGSCGHPLTGLGQQGGIPFSDMESYIQDILDLVEYANGAPDTEWGARRAEAGHPEPFGLKYIGIGNEDMITEVFEPRFRMIYDVMKEKHPEITVIGTVGPFYEGSDYEAGWDLARSLDLPMVDEHYYVSPGWLIYNRDYYDSYRRDATKVYLGEYAAHLPGRPSNVETALADALYLTDVERNGDVVAMTSYAPLLAKKGHTQWNPDMIYFDNTSVSPTVEYHSQKLFGLNSGDTYIPSDATLDTDNTKVKARVGASLVKDSATGDYILKVVNLLPVGVKVKLDCTGIGVKGGARIATQISGDPADKDARPVEVSFNPSDDTVPPYSLTVIRLR